MRAEEITLVICGMPCLYNPDGICMKRGNLHIVREEPTPFGYEGRCGDYKERLRK